MSQSFIKGALIITIATMLSKVLGSVFRIPLQNIAGDEVLGIFTIVYPVYMSVLILSVAGIPLAISKLISEARVHQNTEHIRNIFVTASILAFAFGIFSFALMFGFAEQIAMFLGGSYAVYSIMIVSITLLVAPYMAVYRGFFQGFGNMTPTAFSQVLEQLVRVGLILIVAWVLTRQFATDEVVAGGVMIGSSIGALASLTYLRFVFMKSGLKPRSEQKYSLEAFIVWTKKILKLSIPICIGALTMALLNMVDSLTVPLQLGSIGHSEDEVKYMYGIYGRGLALVQIAVVFASALILPLIPAITAELAKGNIGKTREIIEKGNRFTNLTAWPAAVGLFALTLPLNLALFTNVEGSDIIAILVISALFTSFSVLTTGMLQGMNKVNQAAIIVVVCAVVKVVLNIILVQQFGLVGAAWSTLLTYMLLTALNLFVMYRTIPFKVVQRPDVVFAVSSIVMGLVIFVPLQFVDVASWTRLLGLVYVIAMIGVGIIVYGICIYLLKGISKEELQSFPVVGKFIKRKETT
ncbi:putative polysaccharide biosynthesis protein [Bacillus sp. FJAT-45350]|uniref:putative polysaccharide biosynthesis protein n=1 Tax=Bacillus sp. FJAT-45350 TaxID=2011014 RepID=UPI000BB86FE0|nr:polysaccharide biosynthesis protein [Bacillus sp. FJAT-45350]